MHSPAAIERAEPRYSPAEEFARASRAVRLSLALEARFDTELAALLRGDDDDDDDDDTPYWEKPGYIEPLDPATRDQPSAHRNRIRDAVWDVIDHEITELHPAVDVLQALHERLAEGERYDTVVFRPLRESVESICKDLGLAPDWSRWTEDGFPRETRRTSMEWSPMWLPLLGHGDSRLVGSTMRPSPSALPPAPS